jgi:hypothetical protein
VEHDEETIHRADYVIDLGPGAGLHGGGVVASGTPQEIMQQPQSLTGQYISGAKSIATRFEPRATNGKAITVLGARGNNLRGIDVTFPLGVITVITGVVVALASSQLPVGLLADTSNSGTLLAFAMVAMGVLILRKQQPDRPRPFRTPMAWIVCPLAVAGCLLLFFNLSMFAKLFFVGWAIFGLALYGLYGYKRSHLANGTMG